MFLFKGCFSFSIVRAELSMVPHQIKTEHPALPLGDESFVRITYLHFRSKNLCAHCCVIARQGWSSVLSQDTFERRMFRSSIQNCKPQVFINCYLKFLYNIIRDKYLEINSLFIAELCFHAAMT